MTDKVSELIVQLYYDYREIRYHLRGTDSRGFLPALASVSFDCYNKSEMVSRFNL